MVKRMVKAVGASVIGAALTFGATGPAEAGTTKEVSAAAVSCYGSGSSFTKPEGGYQHPVGIRFITTSACADINMRSDQNTFVKVCFPSGPGCQAGTTYARSGQWVRVATNVRDGVHFYFKFYNDARYTGLMAF
ncbi:hypothetical protein [Actinoplanes sp. M2I2]|uniref:hypothetical protein n=1 Tax=Actinoplanes sp. M2I2 TaxID=1734444 RepID=UPI002020A75C|nr:hypothetical protein [Actinoplanes sp. M2I2]